SNDISYSCLNGSTYSSVQGWGERCFDAYIYYIYFVSMLCNIFHPLYHIGDFTFSSCVANFYGPKSCSRSGSDNTYSIILCCCYAGNMTSMSIIIITRFYPRDKANVSIHIKIWMIKVYSSVQYSDIYISILLNSIVGLCLGKFLNRECSFNTIRKSLIEYYRCRRNMPRCRVQFPCTLVLTCL